jgi:hypothetical protein
MNYGVKTTIFIVSIIIVIIILAIFFNILFPYMVHYTNIIEINRPDAQTYTQNKYYTGEISGLHIFGEMNNFLLNLGTFRLSIPSLKVYSIRKQEIINLHFAKSSEKNILIVVYKNQLKIYSLTGKKLASYIPNSERSNVIVDSCTADLDRDGIDEILLITGKAEVKANAKDKSKIETKPETKSCTELELDTKLDEKLDIKPGIKLDTKPGTESGIKPETNISPEPETETSHESVYGDSLLIITYEGTGGKINVLQKYFMEELNPWRVQTADVDGDGNIEISLGVYKTARYHPVCDKRPFLYNWHKDGISPKWLGSRLSRPFEDYIFTDIDGDGMDELIAIEMLANGNKVINTYKWKGFGFEGIGQSDEYSDISNVCKGEKSGEGTMIMARVKVKISEEDDTNGSKGNTKGNAIADKGNINTDRNNTIAKKESTNPDKNNASRDNTNHKDNTNTDIEKGIGKEIFGFVDIWEWHIMEYADEILKVKEKYNDGDNRGVTLIIE